VRVQQAAPLAGERYHLFGIAGRGMAPLAIAARHLGAEVTGCDRGGTRDGLAALRGAGVPFETAHSPEHVVPDATFVATSVAPSTDPEISRAEQAGGVWHRSDLLAEVLRHRRSVGVTGSHGKGTVTALAAAALVEAGQDPLAIVGAAVPALGGMARLGQGPMIAEVDDSDLTLGRVHTDVAVVTNLDDDHPNLPISLRESVEGVGEFVSAARARVILGPSPRADRLASYARAEVWRYGRDFRARTVSAGEGETRLELIAPDGVRERAVIRLIGPRTALNAALAFAAAISLGAEPRAAAAGLAAVSTIARRLEPVGLRDGVRVFDDYGGKHPLAVRRGIEALRVHFPSAKLIAVFEPIGGFLSRWGRRYARALSSADYVVLAPPVASPDYAARALPDDGWMSVLTADPVRAADRQGAVDAALGLAGPGDVVVFFAQARDAHVLADAAVTGGQVK
jgi:UDP-N-acetylmuramate--alanine ligase